MRRSQRGGQLGIRCYGTFKWGQMHYHAWNSQASKFEPFGWMQSWLRTWNDTIQKTSNIKEILGSEDLPTPKKQAKHVSNYKHNELTWTATWTEDQCMPCLVWFAFQNSVGIRHHTGRCETQIVVLLIVHETQTQNYNVTFFVRSQHENKQTKVSDSKTGIYTTFQVTWTSTLVEWLKSTTDNQIVEGSNPLVSDVNEIQFWPD